MSISTDSTIDEDITTDQAQVIDAEVGRHIQFDGSDQSSVSAAQQQKLLREMVAQMEFEKKALKTQLEFQTVLAERNALEAKVAKMEQEQQQKNNCENRKFSNDHFEAILRRISELEKHQQRQQQEEKEKYVSADQFDAILGTVNEVVKQQQQMTNSIDQLRESVAQQGRGKVEEIDLFNCIKLNKYTPPASAVQQKDIQELEQRMKMECHLVQTKVTAVEKRQTEQEQKIGAKMAEIENAMAQLQTAQKETLDFREQLTQQMKQNAGLVSIIQMEQQQNQNNIFEKFSMLDNFIGVLMDRLGSEMLKAVHPDFRVKLAEKFSNPQQNCWDANAHHGHLAITGSECLKVHCNGDGNGWRSIFAKCSIPSCDSGIFYFEVNIIKMESLMHIGLATKAMPLYQRVGEYCADYTYRSDGIFCINGSRWRSGRPAFSAGDTVGCGIHLTTRRIIFTKNGLRLDTADLFVSASSVDPLFPFVSLWFSGDQIEANFGPTFKFSPTTVEVLSKFHQNCWDANACQTALAITGNECVTVNYEGNNENEQKVWCSVFSKYSILNTDTGIFYFEMKVIKVNRYALIGIAAKEKALGKVRDCHGTYAYESDGTLWLNGSHKSGKAPFSAGDTVGCGVNLATRRIVFTKNGRRLADVPALSISSSCTAPLFPCVSLWCPGDQIEANFGPTFKFDRSLFFDFL